MVPSPDNSHEKNSRGDLTLLGDSPQGSSPTAWASPLGVIRFQPGFSLVLQAKAVTPSAQVSMRVRIESSSYEEMVTCVREKLTM